MPTDYSPPSKSNLKRYLFATILPIIFLSLSLSVLLYDQIQLYSFTRAEIEGVHMIRFLYDELTDLQKIRGYSQISQWSQHEGINNRLQELKKNFLDRLNQPGRQSEITTFKLLPETEHLETRARQLFAIPPSRSEEKHLFASYSDLISEILQLMQLAADHSNLILDPELDTYYLIDVLDIQIPYLAEAIGRVRGIGSGLLAKKTITGKDRERLHNFQAAVQARIESIENAQKVIIKTSSELKKSLHLLPEHFDTFLTPLTNACLLIEENDNCPNISPEHFFTMATAAIDLLTTPYQTGILLLTSKLKTRQKKHLWQGAFIFLGTGLAILFLLFFNRSFYLYDQKLHREMEKLSITDQLTGLYNRRHFYTIFPLELRKNIRLEQPLYIGLLDVDFFKRYNDTYGHPEGDQVLRRMASVMNDVFQRAGDYCFRIGGEEFCFLFSEIDAKKAVDSANRLRLAIRNLGIDHQGNAPHGVVTVSIGLIQIPANPDCVLEEVMTKVDEALYRAKKKGRNQCVFTS